MSAELSKAACDVLREAEKLLARRGGWIKGNYGSGLDGKFCALGAICHAAAANPYAPWPRVVTDALKAVEETLAEALYEFNDRSSTRKKDVLALFQCARQQAGCKDSPS